MSTTDSNGDASSEPAEITVDDIPERVHETLVDQFGEGQERRVRGYFVSQSLRKVMEFIDPEDVVQVSCTRTVAQSNTSIPLGGALSDCLSAEHKNSLKAGLYYSKKNSHVPFPWDEIEAWLNDAEEVYDLPIKSIAFKIDDPKLRDHLLKVLQRSVDFPDSGEFRAPFTAVMRSKSIGDYKKIRDDVEGAHEKRYFIPGGETDRDGNRGLGWTPRTLDLDALWSLRAWGRSGNIPMRTRDPSRRKGDQVVDLTMYDVEELAINRVESNEPVYGAINSKLVVNRWASTFGSSLTDSKSWAWTSTDGWVRQK